MPSCKGRLGKFQSCRQQGSRHVHSRSDILSFSLLLLSLALSRSLSLSLSLSLSHSFFFALTSAARCPRSLVQNSLLGLRKVLCRVVQLLRNTLWCRAQLVLDRAHQEDTWGLIREAMPIQELAILINDYVTGPMDGRPLSSAIQKPSELQNDHNSCGIPGCSKGAGFWMGLPVEWAMSTLHPCFLRSRVCGKTSCVVFRGAQNAEPSYAP